MTRITITDQSTRRVVEYALWRYGYSAWDKASGLYDTLWEVADHAIGLESNPQAEAKVRSVLAILRGVEDEVLKVRDAALGDTVLITTPLAYGLSGCREGIQEAGEIWNMPAGRRAGLIADRDTAERLLGELGEPARVA